MCSEFQQYWRKAESRKESSTHLNWKSIRAGCFWAHSVCPPQVKSNRVKWATKGIYYCVNCKMWNSLYFRIILLAGMQRLLYIYKNLLPFCFLEDFWFFTLHEILCKYCQFLSFKASYLLQWSFGEGFKFCLQAYSTQTLMFLLTFKSLQTLCKYDNTETDMLLVNILEAKQCNCIYFSFFQQIFRKILCQILQRIIKLMSKYWHQRKGRKQ